MRCFFIKDRIEKQKRRTKCCLTNSIVDDVFTKPLQSYKVYKLRNQVLHLSQNIEIENKKKEKEARLKQQSAHILNLFHECIRHTQNPNGMEEVKSRYFQTQFHMCVCGIFKQTCLVCNLQKFHYFSYITSSKILLFLYQK